MEEVPQPKVVENVEDVFRPAFEEIQRRDRAAMDNNDMGKPHFTPSDETSAIPFEVPEQDHVLLSMGTAVLAPQPVDATRPALRIYGAFATREEAAEHAEAVRGVDATCSLMIVRRGVWILMPQNEQTRDDAQANKRRLDCILQAYRTRQAKEGEEFARDVSERRERPPAAEVDNSVEADEDEDAHRTVYPPLRRMRGGAEVRGQAVVALAVVPHEHGECLVKVLGCFEGTAVADLWIRNVASRRVVDDDIHVAATCEWLYPNGEARGAHPHYRDDELQRIMDAADRNVDKVRSYKEWKASQDQNAQAAAEEEEGEDADRTDLD